MLTDLLANLFASGSPKVDLVRGYCMVCKRATDVEKEDTTGYVRCLVCGVRVQLWPHVQFVYQQVSA